MPQFFVKSSDIIGNSIVIKGSDSSHLKKVRRVKLGDLINVRVEDGNLFNATVNEIHSDHITAKLTGKVESNREVPNLTLYAGLLKGKMFDFVLQKSTELGVRKIVPVSTERTVPVISEKKIRWEKIVENAAKQCMRSNIPVIENITSFENAISEKSTDIRIIAHTEGDDKTVRDCFSSIGNGKKRIGISILVGPEGGFTGKEIALAEANNWIRLNFGFTDLRAETASIVIPAIVIHEWSMLR